MSKEEKEEKNTEKVEETNNEQSLQELYEQLTSKNANYMYNLNRVLADYGMVEEDREEQLRPMIETLVEEQHKGTTARQLFGTVRDQARYLAADYVSVQSERAAIEEEMEVSEDWKLYLDGALFLGGLYSVIAGFTWLVSDSPEVMGVGWFTLLMNFLLGGVVMLIANKNAPKPGQKGGYWKYFFVSLIAVLVWGMGITFITALIPPSFNRMLPGSVVLVVGVVALLARWYLKKRLDIKGTMF